jgi:hypothetical protein
MLSIALELAEADVTGIDFLSATPLDSYRCDRAPRGIGFKARYHCICKQRNIRMFERRFDATDVCISLGIDQTRKTVARAAADAVSNFSGAWKPKSRKCLNRGEVSGIALHGLEPTRNSS